MSIQFLKRFLQSCLVFSLRLSSNLLSSERFFSINALCPNAKAMVSTESTYEVCVGDDCTETTYSSSDDPDFESPMGFGFSGAYYMGDAYGHAGYQEPDNTVDDNEYIEFGAGYLYGLTDNIFIDTRVSYRHALGEAIPDLGDDSPEGYSETNLKLYGTVGISVFF